MGVVEVYLKTHTQIARGRLALFYWEMGVVVRVLQHMGIGFDIHYRGGFLFYD